MVPGLLALREYGIAVSQVPAAEWQRIVGVQLSSHAGWRHSGMSRYQVSKETCVHGKRGLLVVGVKCQKRPVYMAKEAY